MSDMIQVELFDPVTKKPTRFSINTYVYEALICIHRSQPIEWLQQRYESIKKEFPGCSRRWIGNKLRVEAYIEALQ